RARRSRSSRAIGARSRRGGSSLLPPTGKFVNSYRNGRSDHCRRQRDYGRYVFDRTGVRRTLPVTLPPESPQGSAGPHPELRAAAPRAIRPGPTLGSMNPSADESSVLIDGPWSHRFVSANGTRFHVVEAGTGPLVLFLHGFPEFWWAWSHQLRQVAEAGFRAVAIDLRGYGASDKPPRGYDGYTMAGDVAGLIRGLGERSAVLVGGGYGGAGAWTTAAVHANLVRRLVITRAAHPRRLAARL